MASTRFAPEAPAAPADPGAFEAPEAAFGAHEAHLTTEFPRFDASVDHSATWAAPSADATSTAVYGPEQDGPYEEWNPTADSVRPVRGRHRVAKQRGGMARSGAVLGVGMIAAVGAGGMAGAKEKPAPIAVPDLQSLAGSVAEKLPAGLHDFASDDDAADDDAADDATAVVAAQAPFTPAASDTETSETGTGTGVDAGDALRARILEQAAQQQSAADATAREEAAAAAAKKAAEAAAEKAEAEAEAEAERRRKAAEEAARKAEAARLAELARSYAVPLSGYTLTSSFGAGGSMWESTHTGQDFAAQTGTPVMAVHGGTVKEAGWAGSYGYRIVLELEDGTEVWYCHLSSMNVSAGMEVTTEDVIGNVGSTGNSTGPHLHLEVRPGGGDPVDPLAWLRGKGLGI